MIRQKRSCRGGSSILAVFFVTLFAVLAMSFTAMSNVNIKMATNHRDMALAHAAAESGLEYAKYLVMSYNPPEGAYSYQNTVTLTQAQDTFNYFADHVDTLLYASPILQGQGIDWDNVALEMTVPASGGIALDSNNSDAKFTLHFTFLEGTGSDPHQMIITSTGTMGQTSRAVRMTFPIQKDGRVLEYAIASRGRMWITGDSTIHGDIFNSWKYHNISPFNMTSDSRVEGTINTVLSNINPTTLEYGPDLFADGVQMPYDLETLDENGNPLYDVEGNKIISPTDEIQGYYEGINYDVPFNDMPGMDIGDYNTDDYTNGLTNIPPSSTQTVEYFPHASSENGGYAVPRDGTPYTTWNRKLNRYVYENQNFTDTRLPNNFNALFINCTFDGVLYVDCYNSAAGGDTSGYNNVRFQDCNFNGVIVTDVPQTFVWTNNTLYFTGSATFQNDTSAEDTILAPHFNVNLGNTNPIEGENNVLTGAIVGGIVDIRGNAEVYGTIISMCDTTQWDSGYVTNIGATLDDGGSETTEPGDVGTINITPDTDKMLPSGIRTPIIIKVDGNTYTEL